MILNISSKDGKSARYELPKGKESSIIGKHIGDKIDGSEVGLAGYELQLIGGSDKSGFPMRADVHGPRKVKPLLAGRPGLRPTRKGLRMRKSVRGNVYSEDIIQINAIALKAGPEAIPHTAKKKESK